MGAGADADGRVAVTLPGGLWADGARHQRATLRPLSGRDEEAVLDTVAEPAAHRVTAVLARCVLALEGRAVDAETIRHLAVGDREALLWHLRHMTVGEQVEAVVSCPACGDKLELDLQIGDLLQGPYQTWETQVTEQLAGREVTFRLPTGADQERVAVQARTDPSGAAAGLLSACVISIDSAGVEHGGALDEEVAAALAARLAELDPQAETLLSVTCPACGEGFTAPLDAAGYVFEEVARRGRHLLREVHALAWHYHWSEAEILAMTAARRRRYLDLIDEALEQAGVR